MTTLARASAKALVLAGSLALVAGVAPGVSAADGVTVAFTTVPVLPNATVRVAGTTVTTDADGAATLHLASADEGLPPVAVLDDGITAPDREARFSRWSGLARGGGRYRAVAVFDLYREVTWRYVERDGRPVDPSMVDALTIRSSHGNVHAFPAPVPVWLQATRAVPGVGGLVVRDIDYRVQSVLIDGAEVVVRNQQQFVPTTQREWAIEVLFFEARFSARDALLGNATGAAISIQHPSGRVERHPLGASGDLRLRLPRGTYRAMVEVPGMGVWTPVALSRDQPVPLKVLTLLDIVLVGTVLGAVAFALLIAGRPHLVRVRTGWPQLVMPRLEWPERFRLHGSPAHAHGARMVPTPSPVRTPCQGGCPAASPRAAYCRFCGTPRRASPRLVIPGAASEPSGGVAVRTGQRR